MKKIVFLILHYINITETQKCVETIKKIIEYKNYEIVIVDNGSKNDTGEYLKNKYNIPVYDIITPTINYLNNSSYQNIGVIATNATINSHIFKYMVMFTKKS